MTYTLGQAAKAAGKSKTAIKNALDKGRISGEKSEDGSWSIDPAELHRVYPAVTDEQDNEPSTIEQSSIDTLLRLKEAETRLEEAEKRLQEKDDTIGDLRTRLDGAERRITALLPQVAQPQSNPPPNLWQRLLGRKAS